VGKWWFKHDYIWIQWKFQNTKQTPTQLRPTHPGFNNLLNMIKRRKTQHTKSAKWIRGIHWYPVVSPIFRPSYQVGYISQISINIPYFSQLNHMSKKLFWTKTKHTFPAFPPDFASFRAFFYSHHLLTFLTIWQCVKTLYPCSSHQNSWDLWMFIPLKMVLIGIDS